MEGNGIKSRQKRADEGHETYFLTDDFIGFLICYKIPNRSISRKKGFILTHSFRGNKSIMLDQHHRWWAQEDSAACILADQEAYGLAQEKTDT